jgi:hypothetical protein
MIQGLTVAWSSPLRSPKASQNGPLSLAIFSAFIFSGLLNLLWEHQDRSGAHFFISLLVGRPLQC